MNSTIVYKNGPDAELTGYITGDGGTVKREHVGLTPNGNPLYGRWVYRDRNGGLIDFNQYRNDLFEQNNLRGPL